jgi:hypothetical protein
MKSRITLKSTLAAAIVAASLFTPFAHAQDGQRVFVSIPFEFSMNRLHVEAGSYEFTQASDRFGMSVINLETGKKQYLTVRPQDHFAVSESGFLLFRRAGGDPYLSEVHFSGAADFSRLNVPKNSNLSDRSTILRGALRK